MTFAGDEHDPFPADCSLFTDTFCREVVYTLAGEELKIRQVFGANLGVAAPVWDAVRAHLVSTNAVKICLPPPAPSL